MTKRTKSEKQVFKKVIPAATMERLPRYLMQLYRLRGKGEENINSKTLGDSLELKDTQIRKDLSYFGVFGKARYGYNIEFLIKATEKILGLSRPYNLAIVGAGNIGKALANYSGYDKEMFKVRLIFDIDEELIGTKIGDIEVKPFSKIDQIITCCAVDIAILAVPESVAHSVAKKLVEVGVKAIYNFSHAELHSIKGVFIENANLSYGIFRLAHHLSGSWPRKQK